MRYKTRRYNESTDYVILHNWWKERGYPAPHSELLNKDYGKVALDARSDVLIAALFMYPMPGSNICHLGWPMTNPAADKSMRNRALNHLFGIMETEALRLGYTVLWTTSSVDRVSNYLESRNFIKGDSGIDQYMKYLRS